jgi:hypothetical protein
MSDQERTIACPICGEPYVLYPFRSGDQSACGKCKAKARGYQWTGSEWVKATTGAALGGDDE